MPKKGTSLTIKPGVGLSDKNECLFLKGHDIDKEKVPKGTRVLKETVVSKREDSPKEKGCQFCYYSIVRSARSEAIPRKNM